MEYVCEHPIGVNEKNHRLRFENRVERDLTMSWREHLLFVKAQVLIVSILQGLVIDHACFRGISFRDSTIEEFRFGARLTKRRDKLSLRGKRYSLYIPLQPRWRS